MDAATEMQGSGVSIAPQSWAAFGRMYTRFAECGERLPCQALHADICRAMAAADALAVLMPTLNEQQRDAMSKALSRSLLESGVGADGTR